MKLLAIETSTDCCSVALNVDGAVTVLRQPGAREQTTHVLPMVQTILADAGVALRALDAIACANGPGAFTGVRIAVSVVQGLAFGANVPAIGISTLAALAQQAASASSGSSKPAQFILPALDARMGELYAGAYVVGADGLVDALMPDRLVLPADFSNGLPARVADVPWRTVGSGWFADSWTEEMRHSAAAAIGIADFSAALQVAPDALDVLALAERALKRGEVVSAEQLLPVYLRDTVAWKKLAEQGKPAGKNPQ